MDSERPSLETQDSTPVGHTPGPWSTRDTHDNVTEITAPSFEDPYNCVANVNARWMWKGPGTDPIQTANARLIAAAPTLLEALTWAVEYMENYEGEVMPEWREWAVRGRSALAAAAQPAGEAQP